MTAALLENCSAFEMGYSCGKKLVFSASDIPHLDVNVLCKKKDHQNSDSDVFFSNVDGLQSQ